MVFVTLARLFSCFIFKHSRVYLKILRIFVGIRMPIVSTICRVKLLDGNYLQYHFAF